MFYLKALDETHAYMILDINTVLPEDTSLLGIDPNRDSVTLVTCTPFGVNTHRLLVRGERIEYAMAQQIVEEAAFLEAPASTWTQQYLRGIGYGCLGILGTSILVVGGWLLYRRRKEGPGRHENT